jgi:hypothetical protein
MATEIGVTIEVIRLAVFVTPAALAVTRNVPAVVMESSFTVNWAVVAPGWTVRVVGIEAVAPVKTEPSETANPVLGAAAVNETVHTDDTDRVIVVGLHVTAESATGRTIVTVAGAPAAATTDPVGLTADTSKSWIAVEVADVFVATVTFAVASGPVAIVVAFIPTAIHVYLPALIVLQVIVLPAPVAADPAVTDTVVMSEVAKPNVHITPLAAVLPAV